MFLNTRMDKPIVADRDIECFLYIRKYNHVEEEKKHGLNWLFHRVVHKCDPTGIVYTKYYEPFRNIEMKPGTTIAGKAERIYSGKYNGINHYRVEDGFVNGMLREDDYGVAAPYKATIPQGTEFYVNNGLFRIAARKMVISKEKVTVMPSLQETLHPILPLLVEELFGYDDKIRPGFYYLNNGTYLNPYRLTMDYVGDVCGIVADINGDMVTVMSLDEKDMIWCKLDCPTRICSDEDVDSSGDDIMLKVMRSEHYGDAFLPARWCSKYETVGGLRGSWHMGSVREVVAAIRENMLEINLAIALLNDSYETLTQKPGRYVMIDSLAHYWTGVDCEDNYAYSVDGCDGSLIRCRKTSSEQKVRAFMTKIKPFTL